MWCHFLGNRAEIKQLGKFLILSLFGLQRSKIACDRVLYIPGKVFAVRPTVTFRKKTRTHSPSWWRGSLTTQYSFTGSNLGPRDALPLLTGPRWLHSIPSGLMESTSANVFHVLPRPATPLTRCSTTNSVLHLTVPLQLQLASFLIGNAFTIFLIVPLYYTFLVI